MIPAINIFKNLIIFESSQPSEFSNRGKVTKIMTKKAYKLISENRIIRLDNLFTYYHTDNTIETINTLDQTCSCIEYLDKACCKHLTAGCIIDKVELNGLKLKANTLRSRQRKRLVQNFYSEINNLPILHLNREHNSTI